MTYRSDYIDKPERQCHGKMRYPRRQAAKRAARRRNNRQVHPYHCPHCDYWHLGNNTPRPKEDT